MIRFRVVGRREEPTQQVVPSIAPGQPQQMQWVTMAQLLVVPVDAEGKTITGANGIGGSGVIVLVGPSMEEISEYQTDFTYALVSE
jgi:hypothetical protein